MMYHSHGGASHDSIDYTKSINHIQPSWIHYTTDECVLYWLTDAGVFKLYKLSLTLLTFTLIVLVWYMFAL